MSCILRFIGYSGKVNSVILSLHSVGESCEDARIQVFSHREGGLVFEKRVKKAFYKPILPFIIITGNNIDCFAKNLESTFRLL